MHRPLPSFDGFVFERVLSHPTAPWDLLGHSFPSLFDISSYLTIICALYQRFPLLGLPPCPQGAFQLSFVESGALPAAFLGGLLLSSPCFAEASKHFNGLRLIAVGLFVWALSVFGCSVAWSFESLIAMRSMVGVGEASFVALAAPYIDDAAPKVGET